MKTSTYILIAIAIAVGLILWRGGAALYDAGYAASQQECQRRQQEANEAAREREQGAALSSDVATDTARRDGAQASAEARESTTQTIETIRYVYRAQPAPVCGPDAVAPDRVQDALSRAYDAAAAAAR